MPELLCIPIVYPIEKSRDDRLRRTMFGDGYEQVAPDGINNQDVVYNLRTPPLDDREAYNIEQIFEDLQGRPFLMALWENEEAKAYKLFPNKWTRTIEYNQSIISFSIKQHF